MRFKCPNCGSPVEASTVHDGERVICARCQKRLKLPQMEPSLEMQFQPEAGEGDPPPSADPFPLPPPTSAPHAAPAYQYPPGAMRTVPGQPPVLVVPVPIAHEPEELVQERIENLRESRSERQERRGHYNLDRNGNAIGMTSFALASTALVIALPGWLFLKNLPLFTFFAIALGLPLSLAALPCGIVGCIKPGGNKLFATLGTAGGAMLFALIYPALMLGLKERWH